MKQNLTQPEELDQILMTMAGNDLKKVMGAVSAALNSYLQEVNKKPICTSETQYIAERMTDMHLAGKDMLLCIGEILAVLNETKSPVEPLRSAMQLVDPDYLNALKQVPHVATNGRYAGVLPDSAPSYWHM